MLGTVDGVRGGGGGNNRPRLRHGESADVLGLVNDDLYMRELNIVDDG